MAWFKKTRKPIESTGEKPSRIPEGLWVKCPGCTQIIYNKDLDQNLQVCPKCAHHFRINATDRLRALFDDGEWTEHFRGLTSNDPLKFTDTKPYRRRLKDTISKTGMSDAVIVATGRLDGLDVVVAAMEYAFIGGSMGVVVGEKITRGIEVALERRTPVIIISCSGGARMMEGALSLMQMAKVSAALAKLDRARLPFISVLTDPTTGGVTARRQRCLHEVLSIHSSAGVETQQMPVVWMDWYMFEGICEIELPEFGSWSGFSDHVDELFKRKAPGLCIGP